MVDPLELRQGIPVIGADGATIGIVESIEGDTLRLRRGSTADGRGHRIPLAWIDRMDGGAVHLNQSRTEEAVLTGLGMPDALREGVRRAGAALLLALAAILLLAWALAA
jgi:hypothetical protein